MARYELLDLYPKTGDSTIVHAVIETPRGSRGKYDLDPATGILFLDRPIHSALTFPSDYGYLPATVSGDGDPLDVVVLSTISLVPGSVAVCHIVGAIMMRDESGIDTKVLSVIRNDPRMRHIRSISDLSTGIIDELKHFFVHIKDLEHNKWAEVGEVVDAGAAVEIVRTHYVGLEREI